MLINYENYNYMKNYYLKLKRGLLSPFLMALITLMLVNGKAFATIKTSTGSTNWSLNSTWSPALVPVAGDTVVIAAGHTVTLNVNSAAIALLEVSGTLQIGAGGGAVTITTSQILVNGTGEVMVNAANFISTLYLNGNLTNNGSFDLFNTATSACQTTIGAACNISGSNTPQFYNLAISGNTTANVNLDIRFNGPSGVLINAFTFNLGAYTHSFYAVTDNSRVILNVAASTLSSTGTVEFNSDRYAQLGYGAAEGTCNLNNVKVNGGGTLQLWRTTNTLNGNLALSNNSTLIIGSSNVVRTLVVSGNLTIDNGSTLSAFSTSTGVQLLRCNRNITINGKLDFYNNATTGRGELQTNTAFVRTISGTPQVAEIYNLTLMASSDSTKIYIPLSIYGNITANTGSVLYATDSIYITGGAQTISGAGALRFYNLIAKGGNTKSWTTTGTVANNLWITENTTFNTGDGTARSLTVIGDVTIDNGSSLSNSTGNATHTLTLGKGLVVNGTLDLWYDNDSRTALFVNGDVAHNFTGTPTAVQLYNITLNNSSNNTDLGFACDIEGAVSIGTSATLNSGSYTHTILASWTNNGTSSGSGSYTFDGAAQTITGNLMGNNILFTGSGNKIIAGDITLTGNMQVSSNRTVTLGNNTNVRTVVVGGNITIDAGCTFITVAQNAINNLSIGGNIINNNVFDLWINAAQNTTLTFTGNVAHSYSGIGVTNDFAALTMAASSNTLTFSVNPVINGIITVNNGGAIDCNGRAVRALNNIVINNGGTFEVDDNAILQVANTMSITNNGIFRAVGTEGNIATVTRDGAAGSYTITQNDAAATFHARYYAFNYLNGGITISNGAIDGTNNFSNGSFSNGIGTQSLNLNGLNFANFTAANTVFNAGPTYNVSRTSGTGTITFEDASGARAGENYDNDNGNPGTLINWSYPGSTFYSQGSDVWSNTVNWNRNSGGGGAMPALSDFTNGLSTFVIQNGHTITLDMNIDVLELIVGSGASGTFTMGNDVTSRTAVIRENLLVRNGATVNVGDFEASHRLQLNGNITNNGTVDLFRSSIKNGYIAVNGTATQLLGTNTINTYHFLVLGSRRATAGVALNIQGSVSLGTNGFFDNGGFTHTVKENWAQNTNNTHEGNGTIEFVGNLNSIYSISNFYNLTFRGGGTGTMTNNPVTVANNFSVSNNTIVNCNQNITIGGDFSVAIGSTFSHTANTITFNGTSTQNIDAANATFYTLSISGGGAANPKNIINGLNVNNTTSVATTAVLNGAGDHTFRNNIRMEGVCNFTGSITITNGSIFDNDDNLIDFGTAEVRINGGTVYIGESVAAANETLTIRGNLNINSGTLVIRENAFLLGIGSNNLNASTATTLQMLGETNFPTNFNNYNFNVTVNYSNPDLPGFASARCLYNRSGEQTIQGGITYGELELGTGGTKTANGHIDINAQLDMNNGITFLVAGYNVNIAGYIENGTSSVFQCDGNVVLDGASWRQNVDAGDYWFNNFYITLDAPTAATTKALNSNIGIGNLFSATNSGGEAMPLTVILGANILNGGGSASFNLGSDVIFNTTHADFGTTTMNTFATKNLHVNSAINYNAAGNQSIADGFDYGSLYISGSGNKNAKSGMTIKGRIWRQGGTSVFYDGGYTHRVAGDWLLLAAGYTRQSATGTIILNGNDQHISYGNNLTCFNNLVIAGTGTTIMDGNDSIFGNLTINDGCILNGDNRNIWIDGNWNNSGTGIFTHLSGTVCFVNKLANQTIATNAVSDFFNIYVDKSEAFNRLTASTDIKIKGDLNLYYTRAELDMTNRTIRVGRNANFLHRSNIITTNSTFIFDGAQQYIRIDSTIPFNHVIFTGSGEKNVRNIYHYGAWGNTAHNAEFDVNGNLTIDGVELANSSTNWEYRMNYRIAGNWIVTSGGSFTPSNWTVFFDGNNQSIDATTRFYNFTLTNTGTKTLNGAIQVEGNLTIDDGVTFDVSANNYAIALTGAWYNDRGNNTGVFNARQGTVSLRGGGKNIYTGGDGVGKRFYNLSLDMTTGQNANILTSTNPLVTNNNIRIENNLTINGGTFYPRVKTTVVGNFVNEDRYYQPNNTGLYLMATGGNKNLNPGNATNNEFRKVIIDANGAKYTLLNKLYTSVTVLDSLNIVNGTLFLNQNTVELRNTHLNIFPNGVLDADSSAMISIGNGRALNNLGGVLKLVGIEGKEAVVNRYLATAFTINQTAGTLHAKNYKIEGTGANGFTISGGTIDATYNLSDGIFTGGTGTAYLTLNGLSFADFTTNRLTFNAGPANNIARITGTGIITVADARGTLAGEAHDNDPLDLVVWTYPAGYYWTGLDPTDNTDWNRPQNWAGLAVPDDSALVYLNHDYVAGAYNVNIKNANAIAKRLFLDAQGGAAVTLTLNGYKLRLVEDINIGTNTTLAVTNPADSIFICKNWYNNGTFNHGNGVVTFCAPFGTHLITPGGIAAGRAFGTLNLNAKDATYNVASDIKVEGNLNVLDGTMNFSTNNYSIYLYGNWYVADSGAVSYNHTSGTNVVYLNRAGDQTIRGGTFRRLQTGGSGTKQLQTNVSVTSNLTISAGTILDAQANNMYVGGNWTNNANATAFIQSGIGEAVLNATSGTQQIDNGSATTTFNNVTLMNAGAKTWYKDCQINGNLLIAAGTGATNFQAFTVNGVGAANEFTNAGSTMILQGANNFPSGFETVTLASNSTVQYNANLDQTIYNTTYGNLTLTTGAANPVRYKNVTADIVIKGTLLISDVKVAMVMNNFNMTLTGNLNFPASGIQIDWGTDGTLTHDGRANYWNTSWNIDADITHFNNLVLAGIGYKYMQGNLIINGNLTLKSDVGLWMEYRKMTGKATKSFTTENNSRIICRQVAPDTAFPTQFGSYSLDLGTVVTLYGTTDEHQIIYSKPHYGTIDFRNYTRNVTADGINVLKVKGDFNTEALPTFYDNGRDMEFGGNVYLNRYTPSSNARTITLNGQNQQIRDVNAASLDLPILVFDNGGIKTLGDATDSVRIAGNVTIYEGVTVNSTSNIFFAGSTFTNGGHLSGGFNHTARTFYMTSNSPQAIDPGRVNKFYNVQFVGTGAKNWTNNNADFNGTTFVIDPGSTVSFTNKTYNIYATISNNGTWNTATSNLTFDGGNQTIPSLTCQNVICANTGTKTMGGVWNANDLTINSGVTLQTTVANAYGINLTGNYTNSGTFAANTSRVTFNGSTSPITIQTNGYSQSFYDLYFEPTAPVRYSFTSATNRVRRDMFVGSNANVSLNSNQMVLGSNLAGGKNYTINGTLDVNELAILKFNNQTSQCVMDVAGTLRIVGTGPTSRATITREIAGVAGNETKIRITTGTIHAKYYEIEYLADSGLIVRNTAHVDATNNFSEGIWTGLNTAGGPNKKWYLYYNAPKPAATDSVKNVTFNFTGTPVVGVHHNVRRDAAATDTIYFIDLISGVLGEYQFEDDGSAASATAGTLRWPAIEWITWTGAANLNWHNIANWSPAIIPGAGHKVRVPLPGNGRAATITVADAVCKTLEITTGRVNLENGFKLNVNGNILIGASGGSGVLAVSDTGSYITCAGDWTRFANGNFSHGNSRVFFNSSSGSATITPDISAFKHIIIDNENSEFSLTGGTINISGDIKIVKGTLSMATANYTMNLSGNFVNDATFTRGTGTVILNGAADQYLSRANFNNLTVSGAGTKYVVADLYVNGNLTVNSTLQAYTGSVMDIDNGVMRINNGATFNDGGETHYFSGTDWYGTGNYIGNGMIIFDRTGPQNIRGGKFNDVRVEPTVTTITLQDNLPVDITGSWHQRNTAFQMNFEQLTNTTGTGSLIVEDGKNIYLKGANNFPKGFATYDLAPGSITHYQGSINQTVAGVTYGNLRLNNATTKTLSGNTLILGSLYFVAGTTNGVKLDVSPNNYKITIHGDWMNDNPIYGGEFVSRLGEVEFASTSAHQAINISTKSTNKFYNVKVNKDAAYYAYPNNDNDFTVNGNLVVTGGLFNANGRNIYLKGDLNANGGAFSNNTGIYYLRRNLGNAIIRTNNSQFGNFYIQANPSVTYTLQDAFYTNGHFYLDSGIWDGNGKYVSLGNGSDAVTIKGTYKVGPSGTLAMGWNGSLNVPSGGVFEVVGASGQNAILSSNNNPWTGRYSTIINGTIRAKYYLMEYMDASGIQITSSGYIDPAYNFSYGTFTNGANGGTHLWIDNNQRFTGANRIVDVAFPMHPGGSASNVKKTATTDTIEFYNVSGVFAGEDFDADVNELIVWTGPLYLTWKAMAANSNWYDANNWTASYGPNKVPSGNEDVFIPSSINPPLISRGRAKTLDLTMQTGGMLYVTSTMDTLAYLSVYGDLTLLGGTFTISAANDTVECYGNWYKAVAATASNNGTVVMRGDGSTRGINNGSASFYNLTFNGTNTYQLGAHSIVRNNLAILQGTLDATNNNYRLEIGGNWYNTGTYISRNGIVKFLASSGIKTIDNGSSSFYDVEINPSNSAVEYQIAGLDMKVYNNLYLLRGTFNVNQRTLMMGNSSGDNISVGDPTHSPVLLVPANSYLKFSNGASVNVGTNGIVKILGTDKNNRAYVSNQGSGRYGFAINAGGTLQAQYYQFDYLNSDGVWIKSGASLHGTHNLSDGIFGNGINGGRYMKIENDFPVDTITIDSVTFNTGATYNVSRTTGTGTIKMLDAGGIRGSYLYEEDDNNGATGRIVWDYTDPTVYWTGNNLNGRWNDALNWAPNRLPDLTTQVYIPDVSLSTNSNPLINSISGNGAAKKIYLYQGSELTLADNRGLTVDGDFYNLGTVTVQSGSTSTITVAGEWFNDAIFGIFKRGNSEVKFNAPSGIINIHPNNHSFHSISFEGNATYQVNGPLRVYSDFTIDNNATMDIMNNSNLFFVRGNWTNRGTFAHRNGIVYLSRTSGSLNFNPGTGAGKAFYTLNMDSCKATVNLLSDLVVSNNFSNNNTTLTGNVTFNANNRNISIGNHWQNRYFIINSANLMFTGSANQTYLNVNQTSPIASVTINKPSGMVNLSSTLLISSNLTMTSGKINMPNVLYVWLQNNATISGGSATSYIEVHPGSGTVRKDFNAVGGATINFPIGDNLNYSPLTFKLNSATLSSAYITLKVFPQKHDSVGTWFTNGGTPTYTNRFWRVNASGITGAINYDISYTYTDGDIVGDEDSLVPVKLSNNLTWDNAPIYGNAGTNTLTWLGVTSFSDFMGANETVVPLPIKLLSFTAKLETDKVKLNWATATETNNEWFVIERSKNARDFEEVIQLPGAGNSNKKLSYETYDYQPFEGINYYRLKQIDFNGQTSYSKIVVVNYSKLNETAIQLYPNPTYNSDVNVILANMPEGRFIVSINDVMGNKFYEQVYEADAETMFIKLPVQGRLPSGVYTVNIVGSDGKELAKDKLIIQK